VGNDRARIVLQQNEIFMTEARVDNADGSALCRLLGMQKPTPYISHPVL